MLGDECRVSHKLSTLNTWARVPIPWHFETFTSLTLWQKIPSNRSILELETTLSSSGLRKSFQVPIGTPRDLFLMSVEISRNKWPINAGVYALTSAHLRWQPLWAKSILHSFLAPAILSILRTKMFEKWREERKKEKREGRRNLGMEFRSGISRESLRVVSVKSVMSPKFIDSYSLHF